MNIDIENLRNDLINYFGAANPYFNIAYADIIKLESASPEELIFIAESNNFNLNNYIIITKVR